MILKCSESYRRLKPEDYVSFQVEHLISSYANEVLNDFRSLGCTVCNHCFGYQHRWDPTILLCSSHCVDEINNNLKIVQISPVVSVSKKLSRKKAVAVGNQENDQIGRSKYFRPQSSKLFGHKKNSGDSPFTNSSETTKALDTTKDPLCPRSVDEVDSFYWSLSPRFTEDVFNKAYRTNMLKTKQRAADTGGDLEIDIDMDVPQTQEIIPCRSVDVKLTNNGTTKHVWLLKDMKISPALHQYHAACSIMHRWSYFRYTVTACLDMAKLEDLQNEIRHYCKTAPPLTRVPAVDEVVFAPYDGQFYRASVDEVHDAEIYVTFIDFGDEICVDISQCREACGVIMSCHPVYGVMFDALPKHLEDQMRVQKPDLRNLPVPSEVLLKLKEVVFIAATSCSGNRWKGTLFVDGGKNRWDEIMMNYVAFQDTGANNIRKIKSACNINISASTNPQVFPHSSKGLDEEAMSAAKVSRKGKELLLPMYRNPFMNANNRVNPPDRRTIFSVNLSPNLYHGAFVMANFMWNYQKIHISAKEDDANIERLITAIEAYIQTAPPLNRIPEVDEIILAPYDDSYYRGAVKSVKDNQVHVQLLDYGDDVRVYPSSLIELTPEINEHPIYGITLFIPGIPDKFVCSDSQINILDNSLLAGGYVSVEQMERLAWTGDLWLKDTLMTCWSDLVLEISQS